MEVVWQVATFVEHFSFHKIWDLSFVKDEGVFEIKKNEIIFLSKELKREGATLKAHSWIDIFGRLKNLQSIIAESIPNLFSSKVIAP